MTRGTEASPKLARLLVRWTTPGRYRDEVLGDLEEAFLLRAASMGARDAHRWYWGHAIRSVAPSLRARLRGRRAARRPDLGHVKRNGNRHGIGGHTMGGWIRHVRLAARSLARKPGFAALAIMTLGLGIGANTAIFSVVYGSLLRPLPYADISGLVYLSDGHDDFGGAGIDQTVPNLLDLREGSRLLESVAIFGNSSGNIFRDGRAERVLVMAATSELFGVLGTPPVLGRGFLPADDVAGSEQVAVITDGIWRRNFGADPGVVGQTMILDARPVGIIGVLPADFWFPSSPEVFVTLQHEGAELSRGSRNYNAVGRLAPGATLEVTRGELQGIFEVLVEQYPAENGGWYTWAEPFETFALGSNRQSLYLLGGAVLLVLLIACVNVANLMLVRAETRQRELAVRFALGSGRSGLVPHFLSEGMLLSVLGGVVGVVAARGGVDLLTALYGGSLSRAEGIELNGMVLSFSVVISLLVGLTVGLAPLARANPSRVYEGLREGARGSSLRRSRLGRSLVVTQVALALVIVTGAGLLMKSMRRLQDVELGLADIDQVLTFQVTLPEDKYPTGQPVVGFYDALAKDLGSIPGVEAVGFVNRLPLVGGFNTQVSVWGDEERKLDFVSFRPVTSGYFDALGIRLVSGRWLDPGEYADGTPVTLINETLAQRLFAGDDPLGQGITNWVEGGLRVVGVVTDVRGSGPTRPTPPAMYFPFATFGGVQAAAGMVRTAGAPTALVPHVREAVARLDPQLPAYRVRTMRELALQRVGSRRFAMSLFGVFAGLALLLGAIGIYGVMSFSVAQRSRELGVRLALGARRASVMGMVLSEGIRLIAPGVVIGLALAVVSARLLGALLFQVSTLDAMTYLAVTGVLTVVAVGATYVPALRATRADPLTSIRND